MARLRTLIASLLAVATLASTGCAAHLMSPPLVYTTSATTVRSHEHVEADDDEDDVVVSRTPACNPCQRRVYVTPYYYYYPYIYVY